MNQKTMQVINFTTRDVTASIDIDHVIKVVALPLIREAPTWPDYVVGLINVAGDVAPVVDLSRRLMLIEPESYGLNTPIILCQTSQQQTLGVLVDNVLDIADVTPDQLANRQVNSVDEGLIKQAIQYDDTISFLIDVDKLLGERDHHGC